MSNRFVVFIISSVVLAGCSRSPATYVERGNRLFERGKFDDAAVNYRKALQGDPQLGEAYYRLGLVQIKRQQPLDAYHGLQQAIRLMPHNEQPKVTLADYCLTSYLLDPQRPKALYDQAASLIDQIVAAKADSPEGLRLKGSLALADGKPVEAIQVLRRADQVAPNKTSIQLVLMQALLQAGNSADGEAIGWTIVARDKTATAAYDGLYLHFRRANRVLDARNVLEAAVRNNPDEPGYLFRLAVHHRSLNETAEMNAAINRALMQSKPGIRLQAGDFYLRAGQWDNALRMFEEGARLEPKEKVTYQLRILRAYQSRNKLDDAATIADAILSADAKNAEARRFRASRRLETRKPEEIEAAVKDLEALANENKEDASWVQLADAQVAKGDLDKAKTSLQNAVKLNAASVSPRLRLADLALARKQNVEALKYANEVLNLEPTNKRAKVLRSTLLIASENLDAARSDVNDLLKAEPNNTDVQLQLALLRLKEKRFAEADAIFEKVYTNSGTNSGTNFRAVEGIVATHLAQKRGAAALDFLQAELRKDPKSTRIRSLLATTAQTAGKSDVAIEQYEHLIQTGAADADVYTRLGLLYQQKTDWKTAVTHYIKAEQQSPGNATIVALLAAALKQNGRLDEAQKKYRRALELSPDNPAVMNNLAYLIAETGGDLDDSLKLAQRAVQKLPNQPVVADTLGWIYLKKNMNEAALQIFTNLVRKHPENPMYRYHYAMALLKKGDKVKARSELNSALEKKPAPDQEQKIRAALTQAG